jgi:hypothetical protein
MTSQRKIEANRRNAKRSTGPKTLAGKMRSRANAVKLGLASVTLRQMEMTDDQELYEALLGPGQSSPEQREHALAVTQATQELEHIRFIRAKLAQSLDATNFTWLEFSDVVLSTERYERRALARRRKAEKLLMEKSPVSQNEAKSDS